MPIKGEKVPLHVRPWPKATVVGYISDGDIVTVLGRRGSFYTISPPPTARAWVSRKYVNVDDSIDNVPQAEAPKPGVVYGLKKKAAVKSVKKSGKDPAPGHKLFSEFMKKVKKKPAVAAKRREPVQVKPDSGIENEMLEIEKELQRIKDETVRKKEIIREELAKVRGVSSENNASGVSDIPAELIVADINKNETDELTKKIEFVSGWIEFIGHGARRPAAYRLVKGGEILFLLRSGEFNLQEFVNRRVEIDGDVQLAPGFEANVLVVKDIRIKGTSPLTEKNTGIIKNESFKRVEKTGGDIGNISIEDTASDNAGVIEEDDIDSKKDDIPVILNPLGSIDDDNEESAIIDQKDIGTIISVE